MPIAEGTAAPEFKLFGTDGKEHQLSEFKGKYLVLYFYPKDDTPGCTREACNFRDATSEMKKLGAEVVGVSDNTLDSHNKFKSKYKLNFLLLADPERKVLDAYGVYGKKSIFGKLGFGTIRSTFIINKKGKVVKVFSPVKVDGHDDEVLEALKSFSK